MLNIQGNSSKTHQTQKQNQVGSFLVSDRGRYHAHRSYYRCTYREGQGCLAKKTVQQEDSCADPPSFKVEYSIQHTCKTIDAVVPFVMDSTPKEALIHTGGFSSEQHLSLSSDTGGNLIQDESLWIYDQMQECPPLVPELLGKMDMASSILSPTGPWDWDMLMGDDDGW